MLLSYIFKVPGSFHFNFQDKSCCKMIITVGLRVGLLKERKDGASSGLIFFKSGEVMFILISLFLQDNGENHSIRGSGTKRKMYVRLKYENCIQKKFNRMNMN